MMLVEIPSVFIGAMIGAIITGFAFAMSTAKTLVSFDGRLHVIESQLKDLGEFRPKSTRTRESDHG